MNKKTKKELSKRLEVISLVGSVMQVISFSMEAQDIINESRLGAMAQGISINDFERIILTRAKEEKGLEYIFPKEKGK